MPPQYNDEWRCNVNGCSIALAMHVEFLYSASIPFRTCSKVQNNHADAPHSLSPPGPNTPLIAGIVAGAALMLLLLIGYACLVIRRRGAALKNGERGVPVWPSLCLQSYLFGEQCSLWTTCCATLFRARVQLSYVTYNVTLQMNVETYLSLQ